MHLPTYKTLIGYWLSRVRKLLNKPAKSRQLNDIYNFLAIDAQLFSSGQPNSAQFSLIKQSGVQVVINLAPHTAENAIANEAEIVASLGMQYQHIPVDFDAPTEQDFQQFCQQMKTCSNRTQKVWVHCAANMRASTFIYRYRVSCLGIDQSKAQQDLHKIWRPFGVWQVFVAKATTAG